MKQAIDELKAIPGVVGACLFSTQEGLLESNLPGMFKPEKLAAVGKQVTKLLAAGRMSFDDLNDLSLHYDESVVIARELRRGLTIFAVCDPSFNHNLLTMSLNLLQEELRNQPEGQPVAAVSESVATKSAPAVTIDPSLEPLLGELKAALAKVLGPMASIIFDELQQNWAQEGATPERLSVLLEMINREIGDTDKIAAFSALTAPLLAE